MTFRQQEPVVPGMLHQPASGFHQPLLETRERPALDQRRQDQSAPEVAQVVGQDTQLQAHFVRPETVARARASREGHARSQADVTTRRQRKVAAGGGAAATTVVELETQSAAGNPNYLAVEQRSDEFAAKLLG